MQWQYVPFWTTERHVKNVQIPGWKGRAMSLGSTGLTTTRDKMLFTGKRKKASIS